MNGMIVILSGPSGAGKGRIGDELVKRMNMRKVLSVTTREKRPEDKIKNNYMFYTEEVFLELKEHGKFFETNYYDGHWYGTLRIPEEELNVRDLLFDKDVNGALAIKAVYPFALTFYIMPKDKETLLERRGNRGEGRKAIALEEVPKAKGLDFLIVNDDLEEAVGEIMDIIECMRKCSMRNPKAQEFMDEFYREGRE